MAPSSTVLDAPRQLMRKLELTVVFGNPGSTEEPFLKDWPLDITYVLGLHEGSVVGMADGYARAMRRPVMVNLHTAAGVGNAMGALATAWHNKAPLVVTAGQQTREMLLLEPLLTNLEATTLDGARAGRAGGADADPRHGHAGAVGSGLPVPADGRLGQAGRRADGGAQRRYPAAGDA